MMRSAQFSTASRWTESTPLWIAGAGAAATLVGLATWVSMLATGNYTLVNAFFRYPNAIFTVGVCLTEVVLCYEAWKRFDPSDGMRSVWLWLLLASIAHLSGRTLATPGSNSVAATQTMSMNELGRLIAGPVQWSLMLAGLLNMVANCRKLGLLRRLKAIDYVLLALVAGFMVRTVFGTSAFTGAGKTVSLLTAAMWTSDPLLLLLLGTAIVIRRAMAPLGYGLLANCWRSFIVGIVLLSLGSASSWCFDCLSTGIPVWTSLGWYVWLAADCALALGPALQVAALGHARNRARVFSAFADLSFWRLP